MGTVVLADVTELNTVKISELVDAVSAGETDVFPMVKDAKTQKISKEGFLRFLESEYEELSNWLDNVTLGDDGLTSIPEIVLVPRVAALADVVGGMFLSSVDKSVYICVEI